MKMQTSTHTAVRPGLWSKADGKNMSLNIAIVDDDNNLTDIIALICRIDGHDVTVAPDVAQAMALPLDEFDVMVIDLHLPKVNGMELLRQLAKRNYGGKLIVISGADDRVLSIAAESARRLGLRILGTINKPFRAEEIRSLLAETGAADTAGTRAPQQGQFTREEIVDAIESGAILPHYQPIVSLAAANATGMELLARWNHPTRGLLQPSAFIEQISTLGLMDDLTMSMLRQGARDLAKLRREGHDISLSVNIEIASLEDENFPSRAEQILDEEGIAPSSVILEVTERSAIVDRPLTLESLARVCLQGFRLAIDDFGTGHSSFAQLDAIPFDYLKIDRQFVARLGLSTNTEHIVRAVVDLAHSLGAHVIAEGVETYEQLQILGRFDCDKAQGYLVSVPLPAEGIGPCLTQLRGS